MSEFPIKQNHKVIIAIKYSKYSKHQSLRDTNTDYKFREQWEIDYEQYPSAIQLQNTVYRHVPNGWHITQCSWSYPISITGLSTLCGSVYIFRQPGCSLL